ncbi:sugar isomerase, partial [Actinomadura kijaniata]
PGGTDAVLRAAEEATAAVTEPLPAALLSASQWTFLGRGWAYGLAQEAALKMREAAGAWTEAYPAMEYRHGPVAIAGPGRV